MEIPNSSQAIYETLKAEILNLKIKPGELVLENEVGKRFAVSRTPVRTAFQRLKDEGLLHVVPYKATYATLIDFNNVLQLIYMRIAIETKVVQDFIRQADPMQIEMLHHNYRRQTILISGDVQVDEFYHMDARYHQMFYQFVNKEILWQFMQRAQIHYTRFRMLDIVETSRFAELVQEHQQLFEIVKNGATQEVEPFITRHMHGGVRRLGKRIFSEFEPYFLHDDFFLQEKAKAQQT